ncbi:MAG TPA: TetR family transcriptional regulator [Clostridia bacterium]|nr:TetR family transcriptional regulator [Clostridia bacterium]
MKVKHVSEGVELGGRRERRRAETRDRLFREAIQLFSERGFNGTTVEDITEAADVGKGTFFNYFPSKEHILTFFADAQRGKVEAAVALARASVKTPVRDIGRHLLHELAEQPAHSPDLARSLITSLLSSPAVRDVMLDRLARGRERLAELLAIAKERGELRPDVDALEMARMVQQVFFGTLLLWSLTPDASFQQRLDDAFHLFWEGAAAPVKSGKPSARKRNVARSTK